MAVMESVRRWLDRTLRGGLDEVPRRPPTARGQEFTGAWLRTPVGRQALAVGHQEGRELCP